MNALPNEIVNWDILNEIISMDEDDPGFSKELIIQYFEQANQTFGEIDELCTSTKKDLQSSAVVDGENNNNTNETIPNINKKLIELSNLGHFLKGSSSALGLTRIAFYCGLIQNAGKGKRNEVDITNNGNIDSSGGVQPASNNSTALQLISIIESSLKNARLEFDAAKKELQKHYGEDLDA